ncbi:ATP-binding protein [Nitrospira sp. Kam-Ns4a]
MRPLLRLLSDLPIQRKLLLTAVIPILAIGLMSGLTYRSVQTFSDDEEQLNNIYLVQRRAAEYMSLVMDLQSAFRGFVLTGQQSFLTPYQTAEDRLLTLGDTIDMMVHDRAAQRETFQQIQTLVTRMIREKDDLIKAIEAGRHVDALAYVEQGRGRAIMTLVRERMATFNRLEQDLLNDALARIARDRSSMMTAILVDGVASVALLLLVLQFIARSITGPLTGLAKAVGSATGGAVPQVPVLTRQDEIGHLTRVMAAMSAQIRDHILQIEKSEAELRLANEFLSASESKYRSIVDHAPFGIFTTRGTAMVFSNRYNWILAGLDPDRENDPELIRQAIHPEDRGRVLKEYAEAVSQDRPYETVFRFLHKDGTVRKVLSRRIPIKDAEGRTTMYQGFNIDITALDDMQTRLSRAERLATLGQVAAGIAHEIRNPLVGIGSTVALLLDDVPTGDPRRGDLEIVLNETRRLDRIVNQIIDYVRPRELAPVLFNMEDLVREALSLLSGAIAGKQLRTDCLIHPGLSQIQADRDQLKQVLINVLQNAIEASRDGGRLEVAAFNAARNQEPGLLIRVADEGAGIPPEALGRIFEPFFTTGKPQGTGLGLAICRNIVEAHRGRIQVESEVGAGTTVKLWLPLQQPVSLLTV